MRNDTLRTFSPPFLAWRTGSTPFSIPRMADPVYPFGLGSCMPTVEAGWLRWRLSGSGRLRAGPTRSRTLPGDRERSAQKSLIANDCRQRDTSLEKLPRRCVAPTGARVRFNEANDRLARVERQSPNEGTVTLALQHPLTQHRTAALLRAQNVPCCVHLDHVDRSSWRRSRVAARQ